MIDTELQPVRLVQAEAVDDMQSLRFVVMHGKEFEFAAATDLVLKGVESDQQVGICRAFYVEPSVVNFLVTLDYESAERLLLESDRLGLRVRYDVEQCGPWNGAVVVSRLRVEGVGLILLPPSSADRNSIVLPLQAVKKWRWA